MKKQKIGIDLDDTTFEFVTGLNVFHNEAYGTAYERHHYTTFDLQHVWGCTEDEANRRVECFFDSPVHRTITAVLGAKEALTELTSAYEPVAITARGHRHAHLAHELIERYFSGIFGEVHFLGHHADRHAGPKKTKGALCQELGVRFMVDDALHNAQSVGEKGIPVFLMNQPWNQGELPPNTIRVSQWSEILHWDKFLRTPL